MLHNAVIILVWEVGPREENSGRKRGRTFKLKSEGEVGASREKQCWEATKATPRAIHQKQGTNVGMGSVARVRGWSCRQSLG